MDDETTRRLLSHIETFGVLVPACGGDPQAGGARVVEAAGHEDRPALLEVALALLEGAAPCGPRSEPGDEIHGVTCLAAAGAVLLLGEDAELDRLERLVLARPTRARCAGERCRDVAIDTLLPALRRALGRNVDDDPTFDEQMSLVLLGASREPHAR